MASIGTIQVVISARILNGESHDIGILELPIGLSTSPDVIKNDVAHNKITITAPAEISYETLKNLMFQRADLA